MTKKNYITPRSRFVNLYGESPLLTGSLEVNNGQETEETEEMLTRQQGAISIWD